MKALGSEAYLRAPAAEASGGSFLTGSSPPWARRGAPASSRLKLAGLPAFCRCDVRVSATLVLFRRASRRSLHKCIYGHTIDDWYLLGVDSVMQVPQRLHFGSGQKASGLAPSCF